MYPNCIPQRPISNNLVKKDLNCIKEGEKNVKKRFKVLTACIIKRRWSNRWRTPTKPIAMKKVWRPKQIVSSLA